MSTKTWAIRCVLGLSILGNVASAGHSPYLANGVKIGEVTPTSAIVWTRLTRKPERNPADGPMVEINYARKSGAQSEGRSRKVEAVVYPEGVTVAGLRDAVPGGRWLPFSGWCWRPSVAA